MPLGKLKTFPLRGYWEKEARDFTQWLSDPENIELLSEEIDIQIEDIQTEADVGRFNVDIYAKERETKRIIIIENQLEKTDHSHLGQLITYAAGLEAKYVIWIVKEVVDEHRQAVDWLNVHTDKDINFFLVKIELWQIGESLPAPKFLIISSPNEWKKSIHASIDELTETGKKRFEFWQQLKDYAQKDFSDLKLLDPNPSYFNYDALKVRSGCWVTLSILSREGVIRCALWTKSEDIFNAINKSREQIEKELKIDDPIEWSENLGRIICVLKKFDFKDITTWTDAFKWLCETTIRFKNVFSKDW